jgi:hypothetical protein
MLWSIVTIAVALIVLYGFFAVVGALIALGGWKKLHADFAAARGPSVGQRRWGPAYIGSSFYQLIRVTIAEPGLFLSCPVLFFHGNILIPWTAISPKPRVTGILDYGDRQFSVVTTEGPIEITLYSKLAKRVEAKLHTTSFRSSP